MSDKLKLSFILLFICLCSIVSGAVYGMTMYSHKHFDTYPAMYRDALLLGVITCLVSWVHLLMIKLEEKEWEFGESVLSGLLFFAPLLVVFYYPAQKISGTGDNGSFFISVIIILGLGFLCFEYIGQTILRKINDKHPPFFLKDNFVEIASKIVFAILIIIALIHSCR